ncbi:MAG: outer membrane beta-barrel protein [Legionellales bacterium]|nr:outer membrane beta-barrel protein [Legionellales bacterium]
MKILVFLFFLGFSVVTFAGDEWFYTGVQLGESKIDSTNINSAVKSAPLQSDPDSSGHGSAQVDIDNDGFAGRAYAGIKLSPYFDIEGGYTQYASVKIKNIYGVAGKNAQLNEGAIDTVLKMSLPLANNISIYGKGGAAFVMTNQLDNGSVVTSTAASQTIETVKYDSETVDRFRPTYGFGVNYDITRFLSTDFSFARVIGGNDVPTSDLIALGMTLYLPARKK